MKTGPVVHVTGEIGTAVPEENLCRPLPVPPPGAETANETQSVSQLLAKREQIERRLQHIEAQIRGLERRADICTQNLAISTRGSRSGRHSPGLTSYLSAEQQEAERTRELLNNARRERCELRYQLQEIDEELDALIPPDSPMDTE